MTNESESEKQTSEEQTIVHKFNTDRGFVIYSLLVGVKNFIYYTFVSIFYFVFFTVWFMGIHYAKGFWSTTFTILPPYAWYLVTVEWADKVEEYIDQQHLTVNHETTPTRPVP